MQQSDRSIADSDPHSDADRLGNGDPIHALILSLGQLRDEVRTLYEIRLDQVRAAVREVIFSAVARLVGWAAALAFGFVAVCFVMYGTALELAALCGDRSWAGFLLAGVLLLAAVGSIVLTVDARDRRRIRQRLEEKHGPDPAAN